MRVFKEKECKICGTVYTPVGSSSKYCSPKCAKEYAHSKQQEYSTRYRIKHGVGVVGVGKGGMTGTGKDNQNYKNGIGIFAKYRKVIKETIRYCERCGKDLIDANRYQWCVHHKDHDRANNDVSNFELLCKRCHQIEHECLTAFEGVTTKVERDPLTGRYKRTEAPNSES